jgi:hypothetical protein
MSLEFLITWLSLLGTPILAIAIFFIIRQRFPTIQRAIAIGCLSYLALIVVVATTGINFTIQAINFSCFALAYFAFCYLAISCWNMKVKAVRIIALALLAIPVFFGYVLGTIGILGLMFIVGDYTNSPLENNKVEAGIICRTTPWGFAGGNSGYTVRLFQRWSALPFLERELRKTVVDQTESDRDSSCSDVLATYKN